MSLLEIKKLAKSFDKKSKRVLDDVSFSVAQGDVLTIIGESGSGKTTLARIICGLETLDQGEVHYKDRLLSSVKTMVNPEHRKIGLVFQNYALFPHLTVVKNIAYGIDRSTDKKRRVEEVLELVGLKGYENRYPHQLSGGQQQRVALARSLAPQPDLLILDEPFSNLDVVLKDQIRSEVFDIIKTTGVTAIFVTHDTSDALSVSDQIMVLKDGKKIQKGTPEEMYQNPSTPYVASLFGELIALSPAALESFGYGADSKYDHYIRNNNVVLNAQERFQTKCKVLQSIFMGSYYQVSVVLPNGEKCTLESKFKIQEEEIHIGFKEQDVFKFSKTII